MNASMKTRTQMKVTTYSLLIVIAFSLVVFILEILPNLMRDFHLMSSGIVTRGTVVSIGSCDLYGEAGGNTYDVQYIDNKGQTRVGNASECDNNFIGVSSVGDSTTILYAPDDPTVIAAQDGFTDKVQEDEVLFAVFAGVIPIGCALAILLIQLRRYLMVHQKPGPIQGNWLISRIKKSKVAVSFRENVLCRIGIHQGEWTTEGCSGCWQSRFCIFCGKPQDREEHNWPPKAMGVYFKDGSCEKRIACLHCEKTESIGIYHEGVESEDKFMFEPWWKRRYATTHCKRCGKNLRNDYGD